MLVGIILYCLWQARSHCRSMLELLNEFSLHEIMAKDHEAGHRVPAQLLLSLQTDIVDGVEDSQSYDYKKCWTFCKFLTAISAYFV